MQDLMAKLDKAEVLGRLSPSQKQKLASLALHRTLKRTETLFWQGDHWPNVLLITSGQFQSVIYAPDGKSFVVSTWNKGEEFWAHSLFDDEPMPSTLEAVQDSSIIQWKGEEVLQILFANPDATRGLLGRFVKQIRKRRDTISELAFQPVTARLAKLILERIPVDETHANRDLTLDQIASMVASSPEVVCRSLYHLQRAGMLKVTRARIALQDRQALERLVGE